MTEKEIDTGGAAFPRPIGNSGPTHYEARKVSAESEGMSLRDWFAGMAITAMYMYGQDLAEEKSAQDIAKASYEIADAMIEEGKKRGKP